MKPLDRKMQQRVWERVYDPSTAPLTPHQKQMLRRCLCRNRENLAVYEKLTRHSLYTEAFERLKSETAQHIKMLQQMLR